MIFRILLLLLLPAVAPAQPGKAFSATGGAKDARFVLLKLPEKYRQNSSIGGQPIQEDGEVTLHLVPKWAAKSVLDLTVATTRKRFEKIAIEKNDEDSATFVFQKKSLLKFAGTPHDAKDHFATMKPFHQFYDPAKGETLLSSGAEPKTDQFQYPHHRGLFFGFSKIGYEIDGKARTADIWHGDKNAYSSHEKYLAEAVGPLFARHTTQIGWFGSDGERIATEKRTVTVYRAEGGTLLDWSTEVSTELPKVKLDGDPQHAGFHHRAAHEVADKTAKQTYYLRPDGKGKEGDTRNWDDEKKDPKTIDLPWNACSFVVGGERYTLLRIPHPDNPKGTRGSERDYGRFGDFAPHELTPKTPLKLAYRLWLQAGEMTVEECEDIRRGFADVPKVDAAK